MCNTYQGWTNYQTWNVKLWIDNDQMASEYWTEEAQHTTKTIDLADMVKDEIRNNSPLVDDASMYADILGAALDDVNWYEIAESLREDVKDESEEVS